MAYKEVAWFFQRDVEETYNITVGGEVITTTDEHPFWIVSKGWVESKNLVVGDVLTTSDGKELAIEKIEVKKEHKTIYNFKVKDFHTYFVSNLGIWTHNSCNFTPNAKGYFGTSGKGGSHTRNASNQVTANYVWGPDRLLAKRDVSTNKKYYYLYNGHGDVVQIIDESGNIVNNYQYDEWGNILQQQEGIKNAFKYAGEIQDEETGLYYLRARYYDPAVGRFVSKDTYEGQINNPLSLNLYTYVENNPSIYTDPTGNWCTATVNGKYYSHPGKCSGSGNGQDYIPDENATNFGRTIFDAGVNKGKWYPENAVRIKGDKTGISDAIIGCVYDSQCSGFVGGAIAEVPAAYNGVKSSVNKGIDIVKGLIKEKKVAVDPKLESLAKESMEVNRSITGILRKDGNVEAYVQNASYSYTHKGLGLTKDDLGFNLFNYNGTWYVTGSGYATQMGWAQPAERQIELILKLFGLSK